MNGFEIEGLAKGARVVVAMSGGVDSSVVAALVAEAGYEAIGVTLQLYDHGAAVARPGSCCAGADIHDARRVADAIGIPHYVLDYEARFAAEVIAPFADAYIAGETPIPCIACNRTVKFRDLMTMARDLGAAALATGHYVRRVMGADGPEMRRAVDAGRDQSYFLFGTTGEQLAFLRFPLGAMEKDAVREVAHRFDLPVAAKSDSQDICFVPEGRYAEVVEKLRPGAARPGEIVDRDGQVLGRHDGVIHFTIGQRRGLGLGAAKGGLGLDAAKGGLGLGAAGGAGAPESAPLYVVAIDAAAARVVVGPREALACDRVYLTGVNWLAPVADRRVTVKLRSARKPVPARLSDDGAGGAVLHLDAPEYGVARGQAGVFYDGDRVLGGGWIRAADSIPDRDRNRGNATAWAGPLDRRGSAL